MKSFVKRTLYFSYGSNLNKGQMSIRCPNAMPLGTFMLKDWRLVFRGVADIEPHKGGILPVGAWSLTDKCELALDVYEGYPRLYTKKWFNIEGKRYMTYVMNRGGISRPSKGYVETIRQGYHDFGLNPAFLTEAIQHSQLLDDIAS